MMNRRSHSNLYYHLVTVTKHRTPIIITQQDEQRLCTLMRLKAKQHDAIIHSFGSWHDHVHILLQAKPGVALSKVYGEIKGYSSAIWNKNNPDRQLKWTDGVFIETVSPDNMVLLTEYIQNQRIHHSQQSCIQIWELAEL